MGMTFTTVVGLDERYIKAFEKVWPNWVRFRPEISLNPIVFVCDEEAGDSEWWRGQIGGVVGGAGFEVAMWGMDGVSQREKMLTGLSAVPTYAVTTDWFLKIDCDAFAVGPGEWFKDEWFEDNPSFVASPWGYTKPAKMLWDCEEWSKTVPWLKTLPPVVEEWGDLSKNVRHRRVISYVYWGNIVWHRWAWGFVASSETMRLPCPSQDTYTSWLAMKTGAAYKAVKMKQYGWRHSKRQVNRLRDGVLNA